MNVKEATLSNCEKSFINTAIKGGLRCDGRTQFEFRPLKINLGSDWGSCHVALGDTRVLAQVTCEVQQPKLSRPNDGLLNVNLELGPMAAPHFEAGRQSDLGTLINRLLEKALKDSKVIDLSMLCISASKKAWAIRIDINVLNHDGNLIDAASIAALTALAHFRRPDVSMKGYEYVIHGLDDRDPIPLTLLHYPVYVSFAVFDEGQRIVCDPTALEERVAEAKISLAVNSYKELCGLYLSGAALANSDTVTNCANRAAKRANYLVKMIKTLIVEDSKIRKAGKSVGYAECLRLNTIPSYSEDSITIQLKNYRKTSKLETGDKPENETNNSIISIGPQSAVLMDTESQQLESDSDEESCEEEIVNEVEIAPETIKLTNQEIVAESSEEEETIVL